MHPTPPQEIRTPPPRFPGDPGISRPRFCGPRSPIHEWARSGPRRGPTIWGTWPPNASPSSEITHRGDLSKRMGRPGAVIEVDRNTPPQLFHFGEGVRLERLPLGSRVIYAPDPIEPIAHPERAIRRALAHPVDDDPLKALLRPNMRLTI